jgi:hypothetical protein
MIYAGLAGWETDLLSAVRSITQGLPGGGSAFVKRSLDNLHARYISLVVSGMALPRFDNAAGDGAALAMMRKLSADTGISAALSRAFLVSLYSLQKSGKIPEAKYDPVGAKSRAAARSAVDPSALDSLAKGAGAFGGVMGKLGLGIAAIAVLGALVYFRVGRK